MAIVGRESQADIVIAQPNVSARHAFIEPLGQGRYAIRDLGSANGVFINGRRVTEATVTPADQVRFGSVQFEWSRYRGILDGESQEEQGWTIGREPGNDLVIPDSRLSARHARIRCVNPLLIQISDLGSSNGIFVNGSQVCRATVTPADEVRLGTLQVGLWNLLRARGMLASPLVEPAAASPVSHPSTRSFVWPALDRRWIVAAAIVLVLLAVAVWGALAQRNLERLTASAQSRAAALGAARSAMFDQSGLPVAEIEYGQLAAYLESFDREIGSTRAAIERVRQGPGVAPWFPERRLRRSALLTTAVVAEESIAADSRKALAAVIPSHGVASNALGAAKSAREAAASLLDPATDVPEFRSGAATLRKAASEFATKASEVRAARDAQHLTARAEAIRLSLFTRLDSELLKETRALDDRVRSLVAAADALRAHGQDLQRTVESSSGAVAVLDRLATTLLPAVELAYDKTGPLRQFMKDANEPVPGGNAIGLAGRLFGSGDGAPVTPLTFVASVSPQARVTVEVLQGVCESVETAYTETRGAVQAISPMADAVANFRRSDTREAMLAVVQAAPAAAGYFEAHQNTFDPAIQKAEQARPGLDMLRAAATQAPPPIDRVLDSIASMGSDLLTAVEAPFVEAKSATADFARTLREVEAKENAYRARLEFLRSNPEAAAPPREEGDR